MSILICGSMAYDSIMTFRGRFVDHILPDQIHILNVSFLVPGLRQEFGGCAGNIAYNLALLGDEALIMATVGSDFDRYRGRLEELGLDQRHVAEIPDTLTAQAYITTDLDDNQITAFHPGAMEYSHLNRVPVDAGIGIGVISPDGRQGMLEHARQFADAGIPWLFDPGQGLPMFSGEELRAFVERASWVALNSYEARLLRERSGWSVEEIARRTKALIITSGSKGSTIYANDEHIEIPAVPAARIADPTGCGDAYRAGLLHGILHGLSWEESGRLATLLGSLKVASEGTQNHHFTPVSLASDYKAAFGHGIAL